MAQRKLSKKMLKDWRVYMRLVAEAYAKAPAFDPAAAPAWHELAQGVEKAFGQKTKGKVAPNVQWVDNDPYKNPTEMIHDIRNNNRLQISTIGNDHPIFDKLQNLKLRTVHDMVHAGHSPDKENGHAFSFGGEVGAYNQHIKYLVSQRARAALFTEVVGQAAYYLTYGSFPQQKIAFLPGFDYVNIGNVSGYNVTDDKRLAPSDPNQQVDPSLTEGDDFDPKAPPQNPPLPPSTVQPNDPQQPLSAAASSNWYMRFLSSMK